MTSARATAPDAASSGARTIAGGPVLDALLAGGLSLFIGPAVLLLFDLPAKTDPILLAVTASLLNGPHFLSSYLLVYNSSENVRRYPIASVVVPVGLVLAAIASVVLARGSTDIGIRVFGYAASLYLAVHYTGQAWGMVMTFSFLDGVKWEDGEKKLVRFGFRALMVWHMVWFLVSRGDWPWLHDAAETLYGVTGIFAAATMPLGAFVLFRVGKQNGGRMPLRIVLPWLALYLWYGLLAVERNMLFVVQLFHALQYLSFPYRVVKNRLEERKASAVGLKLVGAFVVIALFGGLIFGGLGTVLVRVFPSADRELLLFVSLAVIFVLNIHHYVLDGAIWKISHPAVRKQLFAHL